MMMHVGMINDAGLEPILYVQRSVPKQLFDNYSYEIRPFDTIKRLKELLILDQVDCVWCTTALYLLKLSINGINIPLYLWQQGDGPAESFMHHHNIIRVWILKFLLSCAFRKAAGVVFVSDSMRDYYYNEYGFNKPNIVVPCLSEFADNKINVERIPNSYVYIGGLSVWQCFEDILALYKKIRKPSSTFHIITLDTDSAISKVESIIGSQDGIMIYSIKDRSKIPEVLNKFQYGFLIRKNDIVNQVSSPIKFLEYLSCGVDVIMTDAVPAYANIIQDYHVGTIVDLNSENIIINKYSDQAKKVYQELFNRERYVERYKSLLNQ